MDKIVEQLYEIHLNTATFPYGIPNKEEMDEEWQLYNFLYENLPDSYRKEFLRYINLRESRQNNEKKAIYEYGFKNAVTLIIESLKP